MPTKILLLSDTHGHVDGEILNFAKQVDQVWHAGDIGGLDVTDRLLAVSPNLKAVYGNIDDQKCRSEFPRDHVFSIHNETIWMTHIGGYPPKYTPSILQRLDQIRPTIFVCGHSHILKVVYDKTRSILHLNPGAIGKHGFHNIRTALMFEIHPDGIKNLDIIEIEKR